MGFAAFASAATLKLVAARLPPPAEFGAATGNVARRIPVRPASAVRALMAFVPAGDVEPIGPSLGFATTDHATLGPGARTTVTPGPHGSEIVTVQAPVDLAFLEKVHAIQTQFGPNLSNVAQGRLYVSAADTNAYGIVMNPSTHVAVFRFRLSASDSTIWPLNLNALQVVSQTQSLG